MNNVLAAAITFKKAAEPAFRDYADRVLANAKVLAARLIDAGRGARHRRHRQPHDGGRHQARASGSTGATPRRLLDRVGITTNKQVIPDDPLPPLRASGIRLGTPAATTRGMGGGGDGSARRLDGGGAASAGRRGAAGADRRRGHGHVPRLPGAGAGGLTTGAAPAGDQAWSLSEVSASWAIWRGMSRKAATIST